MKNPFLENFRPFIPASVTNLLELSAVPLIVTINSGAPGKQGFMNGTEAQAFVAGQKAQPTAYLLDHQGVVGKRIDVFATALHAGFSVHDVVDLDLTYAPPLAPVYDPVSIAARVAAKKLAGRG